MKKILRSAMRRVVPAAAAACGLLLSCAFSDEDALESLFREKANPLVVAVGDSSIFLSLTGMSWSDNMLQGNDSLRDVAYGRGVFIAAGWGMIHPGVAYLSEDGVVWFGPVGFSNSLNAVACYKKYFIAGGEGFIKVSLDGMVWVLACKVGVNTIYDFAAGNGLIVAVGGDAASGKVYISADGLGWAGPITLDNIMYFTKIAYGNGTFVALSTSGRVAVSRDGYGWALNNGPAESPDYPTAIAYGKGKFVTATNNGSIYASADGVFWVKAGGTGMAGLSLNDIAYCYGRFIGVGNAGFTVSSSTGLDWREETMTSALSLYGVGCSE